MQKEIGYRDDLESVGYILLYLANESNIFNLENIDPSEFWIKVL